MPKGMQRVDEKHDTYHIFSSETRQHDLPTGVATPQRTTPDKTTSVVTVSKRFLSVGFGRFCRKKPRFLVRFRFSW